MRKSVFWSWTISIVLALIFSTASLAELQTFVAYDRRGRDVVKFESKAPLETIIGTTSQIRGEIKVDPEDILKGTSARFEVDLANIKTGIETRDQHMREQYLETDKYPKIIFTLDRILKASEKKLADQKSVDVVAEGTFDLHGVQKKQQVNVKATFLKESQATKARMPGDLIRVEATIPFKLSDYNVKRPQFVLLKLDDNIKVDIDVFASNAIKLPAETVKDTPKD
jgi:polyisoprenoid-binding protein YceI